MSCSSKCGCCPDCLTEAYVLFLIEKIIKDMILNGVLQQGLLNCGGDRLTKDIKVVQCSELEKLVQDLIDDGTLLIPYPTKFEFDEVTKKLKLTLADNSTLEVDLSTLSDPHVVTGKFEIVTDGTTGTSKKTITLTKSDNSIIEIDVSGLVSKSELDAAVAAAVNVNLAGYQKRLKSCDGTDLIEGTKVVTCDGLTESIRKFVENENWATSGDVTLNDVHVNGGTIEDATIVNPKFENMKLGVDCDGNDITTCCDTPLVTCDYLHDRFMVATPDVPAVTEEAFIPTSYYGNRTIALGAPETFMEVTIKGEQYLIPVFKKG